MDDEYNGLVIEIEYDTKIIRVINNMFLTSKLSIRAEIMPVGDDPDHEDFDTALTKCGFWMDTVFGRCIVFRNGNAEAKKMLLNKNGVIRTVNPIMITPFEPTDDHLACLLQAKLSTLAGEQFAFGSIRIKSDSANGLIFRFMGDADELLPSMKEWMGEKKNYFEMPWWHRDDISTFDMVPPKGANLEERPSWAKNLDHFDDIVKAIRGEDEPMPKIIRKEFKPKIIKGGSGSDDED